MNKLLALTFALVCVVCCNGVAHAEFVTASGYTSTELYSTADTFTTIGGLALDSGKLYFGQFTDIQSLDLSNNSVASAGTLTSNAGNSLVVRHDGVTYTSFGTSYSSPYPAKMGYLDAGAYVNQLNLDGIYDAAVNPNGDCYIVANPGASGSQILKYNWTSGSTTLIADIGGFSGGLAFDPVGNLYYAEQTQGEVLKFTAVQVAAGGLSITDAEVAINLAAGYIGFNSAGDFFATTGWGSTFSEYDLATQSKVRDIAHGSISQFVVNGNDIYLVDTDWGTYSSTIQHVVPEPSAILLLGIAGLTATIGCGLRSGIRRRNRKP